VQAAVVAAYEQNYRGVDSGCFETGAQMLHAEVARLRAALEEKQRARAETEAALLAAAAQAGVRGGGRCGGGRTGGRVAPTRQVGGGAGGRRKRCGCAWSVRRPLGNPPVAEVCGGLMPGVLNPPWHTVAGCCVAGLRSGLLARTATIVAAMADCNQP
jgi:hypothetical protein